MNKADLIEKIAKESKCSKVAASKMIDSLTSNVTKSLKKGERVTLVGFGTFSVSKRKARIGRNPQTGETIKIKAKKAVRFKAGKALDAALNR
jgi:DNA-binding protein HU-beta